MLKTGGIRQTDTETLDDRNDRIVTEAVADVAIFERKYAMARFLIAAKVALEEIHTGHKAGSLPDKEKIRAALENSTGHISPGLNDNLLQPRVDASETDAAKKRRAQVKAEGSLCSLANCAIRALEVTARTERPEASVPITHEAFSSGLNGAAVILKETYDSTLIGASPDLEVIRDGLDARHAKGANTGNPLSLIPEFVATTDVAVDMALSEARAASAALDDTLDMLSPELTSRLSDHLQSNAV